MGLTGYVLFKDTGSSQKKQAIAAPTLSAQQVAQAQKPAPKPPPPKPENRLANGTLIRSVELNGLGQLEVKNGLYQDAAIKLIRPENKQCVAYFYVRASCSHTLKNIPNGTYRLRYMVGRDWNELKHCFNRDVKGSEFDKSLEYTTENRRECSRNYTQYHTMAVTLHRVPEGTAKTHVISEQEFSQD